MNPQITTQDITRTLAKIYGGPATTIELDDDYDLEADVEVSRIRMKIEKLHQEEDE